MSTKQELQQIRSALAARPRGRGRRIPAGLRERIARYAIHRLRDGLSRVAVARELGVCERTVVRVVEAQPSGLVPIRVADSEHGLTVRGPGGITIEGLAIEDVAALIRALS